MYWGEEQTGWICEHDFEDDNGWNYYMNQKVTLDWKYRYAPIGKQYIKWGISEEDKIRHFKPWFGKLEK